MNEEIEIPPEFQDLMNFNGIYNDMNNKKTSYFVSSLYECYSHASKVTKSKKIQKSKTDNGRKNIEAFNYFYYPQLLEENQSNVFPSLIKNINPKRKNSVVKDKPNTSYRKLTEQLELESSESSHFVLNHSHKILMFGRAGSIKKASDDEGIDTRFGNPIFNQDLLNLRIDEISEENAKSDIEINKYVKAKKSNISEESLVNNRCNYYQMIMDIEDDLMTFKCPFNVNYNIPMFKIDYTIFFVISTIISNIETNSKSLKIGDDIKTILHQYQKMLQTIIRTSKQFYFVCTKKGVMFLNMTSNLIYAINQYLQNNWNYILFLDFFKNKHIYLSELLDEIISVFVRQIDGGGTFAKEFLNYRELSTSLELNSFSSMIEDEFQFLQCKSNISLAKIISISRAYFPYFPLYKVEFIFEKDSSFYYTTTLIENHNEEKALFPVFNMFNNEEYSNKIIY